MSKPWSYLIVGGVLLLAALGVVEAQNISQVNDLEAQISGLSQTIAAAPQVLELVGDAALTAAATQGVTTTQVITPTNPPAGSPGKAPSVPESLLSSRPSAGSALTSTIQLLFPQSGAVLSLHEQRMSLEVCLAAEIPGLEQTLLTLVLYQAAGSAGQSSPPSGLVITQRVEQALPVLSSATQYTQTERLVSSAWVSGTLQTTEILTATTWVVDDTVQDSLPTRQAEQEIVITTNLYTDTLASPELQSEIRSTSLAQKAIGKNSCQLVTLDLSSPDLPFLAGGEYQARLLVSSPLAAPLLRQFTVTLIRQPRQLGYRLLGKEQTGSPIVIHGVRPWPGFRDPWNGAPPADRMNWSPAYLCVWEQYGRPVSVRLVASELVDRLNGASGLLAVDVTKKGIDPGEAATFILYPEGSLSSGVYTGTLGIKAEGQPVSILLPVSVALRDNLWYPFLVILIGVFVLRWALVNVVGDINRNKAYHRVLIAQARRRQADFIKSNKADIAAMVEVEEYLSRAEAALDLNDFANVRTLVQQAISKMSSTRKGESSEGIEEDTVKKARRAVRLSAILGSLVWGLIAAVGGLLFIQAYRSGFGSVTDYLKALGWALGVSTLSLPADGVISAIRRTLRNEGEESKPAATPANATTPALKKIIGRTRKEVEPELKALGLATEFQPEEAQEKTDWRVKAIDPVTLTLTLEDTAKRQDASSEDEPGEVKG